MTRDGTIAPCAVDKLNSYRKYGETSTVSQTSKYGVFRTGTLVRVGHEQSLSDSRRIHSPIRTRLVPNFHENYWTNSYNPFAEFQWHATNKLTVTVGDKYAYYTMDFKQFADNGKVVGTLNGAPFVTSSGGSAATFPRRQANYRLTTIWSVYGQLARADEIPPTSLFDVTGGGKEVSPISQAPQLTTRISSARS